MLIDIPERLLPTLLSHDGGSGMMVLLLLLLPPPLLCTLRMLLLLACVKLLLMPLAPINTGIGATVGVGTYSSGDAGSM